MFRIICYVPNLELLVFEDTCFANNGVDVMIILASFSKGQYVFPPTER
jgi:hypothetical protein